MTQDGGTRAARREQAVEALLDAALESLVTVGFAATTTRGVAQLAGVSQGLQQHYFPTKAALIDAAILRLAGRLLDEASQPVEGATERDRARHLLRRVWDSYRSPVLAVVAELLVLARTHPDTAEKTASTLVAVTGRVVEVAEMAMPTYARHAGFRDALLLALSAIRDTTTVTRIPGTAPAVPTLESITAAFLRAVGGHRISRAREIG
ncbi:TetR/AcrR family transcriptional regulator [Actinoplanes sp. NEAU-A12]|uniref:TetR/AcrR family transcriptional regulator n=1 Tax=Actinoplanes sandaracinus TaxID=3045177 RepID=A0ABT6WYC8_9ACTN|nr:TetR/AcrR family transcriptional regulator [Actinoplanes sandaracinus]MDI6104737.1 TetR/AcrR family transcriptional regulator [Actinoplanes sandaracinus]